MTDFIVILLEIKYFLKNSLDFRSGHSTGHALLELSDQICECFDKKKIFSRNFC